MNNPPGVIHDRVIRQPDLTAEQHVNAAKAPQNPAWSISFYGVCVRKYSEIV